MHAFSTLEEMIWQVAVYQFTAALSSSVERLHSENL
jgi:hypothetical protein